MGSNPKISLYTADTKTAEMPALDKAELVRPSLEKALTTEPKIAPPEKLTTLSFTASTEIPRAKHEPASEITHQRRLDTISKKIEKSAMATSKVSVRSFAPTQKTVLDRLVSFIAYLLKSLERKLISNSAKDLAHVKFVMKISQWMTALHKKKKIEIKEAIERGAARESREEKPPADLESE